MTRPTRTLLILGVMAIGGLIALAMMAQRYGEALEGRQHRAAPRRQGEGTHAADAEHHVIALVSIRRALKTALDGQRDRTETEVRAALRSTLSDQLRAHDLDRDEYRRIESVFRAWRAGNEEVPAGYREALDRRTDELDDLGLGGYDPLAL